MDEKHVAALRRVVKPRLQLITGDERDAFTDFRLYDIWRYFRLTWSTPYRSTPGRNLFYLVRDEGQPCHPIIGIAALANCVIGLKCRDDRIGWTADALANRMDAAHASGEAALRGESWQIAQFLERHLEEGLRAIAPEGIATRNTLAHPTPEAIEQIAALALDAARERYEHLRNERRGAEETPDDLNLLPPDALVATMAAETRNEPREQRGSSTALFRRKRAAKIARLLQAKWLFQQKGLYDNPVAALPTLLWNEREWTNRDKRTPSEVGRSALRTALNANKESKIGSAMMEIVVCGAVQPYSHLLGGKLVAMLLTSPEVVRDYEQRYGDRASTIASQVAGHDVTRPAHLVYLGTSSLYAPPPAGEKKHARPSSASQYNRVRIPADVAGGAGEIRYEYVGATEGYGVVHFSADTRKALEDLDVIVHDAKRVNSIFGEGTSPRLRKIRRGIELLGLDDRFLVHGQARLVYAIDLAHNSARYLRGEEEAPDYIFPRTRPAKATKKIGDYWLRRWLASRLDHAPALESVARFAPQHIAVSQLLPVQADSASGTLDL